MQTRRRLSETRPEGPLAPVPGEPDRAMPYVQRESARERSAGRQGEPTVTEHAAHRVRSHMTRLELVACQAAQPQRSVRRARRPAQTHTVSAQRERERERERERASERAREYGVRDGCERHGVFRELPAPPPLQLMPALPWPIPSLAQSPERESRGRERERDRETERLSRSQNLQREKVRSEATRATSMTNLGTHLGTREFSASVFGFSVLCVPYNLRLAPGNFFLQSSQHTLMES